MVEFERAGDLSGEDDDAEDDIARFERQCADRARAEGLVLTEEGYDDDEPNSDDDQLGRGRASPMDGVSGDDSWQQRCSLLQAKLARKESELAEARSDLELLRSDGVVGPTDVNAELKTRLLDITKKSRRFQVTMQSQKSRIKQLEAELKKPREEVRREAEEKAAEQTAAALGDGMEDWKRKYLLASNKLQEARHESQDLRAHVQKQRKVLLKELGSEEAIAGALAVVDDPASTQWRGRAAQITQLQRQVREMKEQARRGEGVCVPDDAEAASDAGPQPARLQRGVATRTDAGSEKERLGLKEAAEKRREEFERLQEEVERLRGEHADLKHKRDALKSRNSVLEGQTRELRSHVQSLVQKSENDDELVAALRKQAGRPDNMFGGMVPGDPDENETLRRENAQLHEQVERQAQIVQRMKEKNFTTSCENGSARLGPKSVESSIDERTLIERVRYLEAENAKQAEQVRLMRSQRGADRPYSPESLNNDEYE